MIVRIALLSLAVLVAGSALAQKPGSNRQTVESSPIDTRLIFPQIQPSIGAKDIVVSQGHLLTDPPFRPNRLHAGELQGDTSSLPGAQFPGIGYSGLTPGDPDIAVGIGHIVEVINSQIGFFTKAGTLQFQQSAQTMFAGMGAFNFQFDPKVSYDRVHDRFVLVFLERDTSAGNVSKILVAVSDDGNPNGTWHRYRIEAKLTINGNEYWMDYPGLGYNKDAYVVNGNMFPFNNGSFGGVQFLVIPSSQAMTGSPVTVTSLRHSNGASAQAADVVDPNEPNVYAISRASSTTVRVYALQNLTTTPSFVSTTVTVPSHSGPAGDAESTNGRFLDTIDARVYNAVWRGGRLLAAHNFEGTSFVGSRWYELDTGTWPTSGTVTLVQSGNVQSTLYNYFCPAINKNKTGKISATFTRSSTSVTADFALSTRKSTDALGTMGAPSILKSSIGDNYSQNRWGDYYVVDVDPSDDVTFWGVHMLIGANNAWFTEILSWTVPAVTTHAPTAFNWFRGTQQSGNLASLSVGDADYLVARAGLVLFPSEAPAQLEVETIAPSNVVYGIDLSCVAKVNTPGLAQKAEAWNFATGQWDLVGQQTATTSDSVQSLTIGGTVADYVESSTGRVRVKFSWLRTGLTLVWPWTVSVDQIQWAINSA